MNLVKSQYFFKSNYRIIFFLILVLVILLDINHLYAQNNFNFYSESSNADLKKYVSTKKGKKDSCLKIENNIFVRHDGGYIYKLIDTAGLFIFIREVTKRESSLSFYYTRLRSYKKANVGYFSKSICGKLIELDYFTLKKYFGKQYPNFIQAAKKVSDQDLISQSDSLSNLTIVNTLFKY